MVAAVRNLGSVMALGCVAIVLLAIAAGHAVARPAEKMLANWFAIPISQHKDGRGFRLEVEPIEFPEWLWWQGSLGFIVRRVPEEEPGKD